MNSNYTDTDLLRWEYETNVFPAGVSTKEDSKAKNMKITTKIYCARKRDVSAYESMNIPVPDDIYDMEKEMVVDLRSVVAVGQSMGDSGKVAPLEAVLYMNSGESFVIGTPYEEVKAKFLDV